MDLNKLNTDFLNIKFLINLYLEPIKIAVSEQDKYYEILKTNFLEEIEKIKEKFETIEEFQPYYESHFYLQDITLIKLKQHNFNSLILLIFSNLESLLKTIIEEEYKNINLKKVKNDYLNNYIEIIARERKIDKYQDLESYKFILNYKKLRNIIVHNNSILSDEKYIEMYNKNTSLNLIVSNKLNSTNKYKVLIKDSKIINELIINSITLVEDLFK